MKLTRNRLIHWIAALAISMSALAPAISQAVSLAKGNHGFAMEICSADGSKMQIEVQGDQSDAVDQSMPCPYCIVHGDITPAFSASFTFEAPKTLALLPELFYQSPKPLAVWVTPPSAAPPSKA
jgi:hypothetical protein